ncbi:type VII secretion protein EccB [Streptomyces sp. NPDC056632]|uniref:type VII secretion protein EccB n=1 Tax=Streptomyces sp. NPDC056632 TaxID=3345884 RepID=UPI0036B5FB5D
MHTRRDQVQAHLFTLSRVTAGLIRAEPDAAETPMRRFTLGTVAGVILGVIALGGMVAFGFVSPGITNSFKKEGTLVLEKETGTRYIYLSGKLHPVLNRTSAMLMSNQQPQAGGLLGGGRRGGGSAITTVSANSLKGVPKGAPVGILGAPDVLPDSKSLVTGPWSICSSTRKEADGTLTRTVTAHLGAAPGRDLTTVTDQETLVVKGEDGEMYLTWLDRRLRIPGPSAFTALGYADVASFDVKSSWLNALPSGSDLKGPDAPGRGTRGPVVGGAATLIGQVLRDPTGTSFLVLKDGLSPLTDTEAALVLSDPATKAAYPKRQVLPVEVGTAAISAAPRSARGLTQTGFPAEPPKAIGTGSSGTRVPCYMVEPGKGGEKSKTRVAYRQSAPAEANQPAEGNGSPLTADRVVVAPGSGMLAVEESPLSEAAPRLYLITDLGVKYQLAGDQVAQKLGYNAAQAVRLPSGVLDLVPTGPVLDVEAAKRTLTTAAAPAAPPQQ